MEHRRPSAGDAFIQTRTILTAPPLLFPVPGLIRIGLNRTSPLDGPPSAGPPLRWTSKFSRFFLLSQHSLCECFSIFEMFHGFVRGCPRLKKCSKRTFGLSRHLVKPLRPSGAARASREFVRCERCEHIFNVNKRVQPTTIPKNTTKNCKTFTKIGSGEEKKNAKFWPR